MDLYGVTGNPSGYVTTPVFAGGAAEPAGRDIVATTLDGCLWFALLAPKPLPASVDDALSALGGVAAGRRQVLSVGVSPAMAASSDFASSFTDIGVRARIPHIWEVSAAQGDGTGYMPLNVLSDTSVGLTQPGVLRLLLPGKDDMGAPTNDVLQQVAAGVGDRPPRIDDPTVAQRLVCWVRLRPDPSANVTSLSLAWAGINAVGIEQRQTLGRQTIGQGTGASGLQTPLGADVGGSGDARHRGRGRGGHAAPGAGARRRRGRARRPRLQPRPRGRRDRLRRRRARHGSGRRRDHPGRLDAGRGRCGRQSAARLADHASPPRPARRGSS